MAKTKSAGCDRCGTPVWPDNRRPRLWLCTPCRYPDAQPWARPLWGLTDDQGRTTTAVLSDCPSCGCRPRVVSHPEAPETPRALTWDHAPGCGTRSYGAQDGT